MRTVQMQILEDGKVEKTYQFRQTNEVRERADGSKTMEHWQPAEGNTEIMSFSKAYIKPKDSKAVNATKGKKAVKPSAKAGKADES